MLLSRTTALLLAGPVARGHAAATLRTSPEFAVVATDAAGALRTASAQDSIYDQVKADPDFSVLAAAIEKADLKEVLSGPADTYGDFTVFAPTDDAFGALPDGLLDIDELLEGQWMPQLRDLVLYHAVSGKVMSADLEIGPVPAVNGEELSVDLDPPRINGNALDLELADLPASNGVMHVLDGVLTPTSVTYDIVEILQASPEKYSTLVEAVTAAGLAETLSGYSVSGPWTLFAPTNDAFADLPEGTLHSLLKPENIDKLAEILKYHVWSYQIEIRNPSPASGTVTTQHPTLTGDNLEIANTHGEDGPVVVVNGEANVLEVNVLGNNGMIHAIDKVLVPPGVDPMSNIVEILQARPEHSTLVEAVEAAGLAETLSGESVSGPWTLFAPTNDAFDALPEGTLDYLLKPENIDKLTEILKFHVLSYEIEIMNPKPEAGTVITQQPTLTGYNLEIANTHGEGGPSVMVNKQACVAEVNILGNNGMIHVVDKVFIPPGFDPNPQPQPETCAPAATPTAKPDPQPLESKAPVAAPTAKPDPQPQPETKPPVTAAPTANRDPQPQPETKPPITGAPTAKQDPQPQPETGAPVAAPTAKPDPQPQPETGAPVAAPTAKPTELGSEPPDSAMARGVLAAALAVVAGTLAMV